ncbi:uncharacterized protein KQ657_000856 [Scheffersomyces spartinae]|uniref:DUF2433 domain-containing protein n=1 Tax=Scheffersomyces spartinae TaxID=45513 RepID=A0A9P8AI32_9ASCO|nr:uncharacterized protein KQ657_000856 [Scheffersomyces spartinae]KAG7193438.1 hypothetical protein KQ657_000856 [Scheffersomyces spartinae]
MSASNLRILAISDCQGNLGSIEELCKLHPDVDIIVHSGNFGFWDSNTITNCTDINYLKQIVSFLEVLESDLIQELNDYSFINGNFGNGAYGESTSKTSSAQNNADSDSNTYSITDEEFKERLQQSSNGLSQLSLYLDGTKQLPCPVYTIFGPLDDPYVINKFQTGQWDIPNLFLLDQNNTYTIETPKASQPNIRLYGLGGSLKIHSLFDSGSLELENVAGKVGDLWITLTQVAELYSNFMGPKISNRSVDNAVGIFVSHAPVIKTPLLEHFAILTNADITLSQGLHFRYPVILNGMSCVDSMGGSAGYIDNYRSKFSRLRMILGELWLIIKDELQQLLQGNQNSYLRQTIELGLSLFDKIPISINDSVDKIIPLTLSEEGDTIEDHNLRFNKELLKKINDYYFQAYYNLWHFNLCDLGESRQHQQASKLRIKPPRYNIIIFELDENGYFNLAQCTSLGFNFKFKSEEEYDEYDEDQTNYSSNSEGTSMTIDEENDFRTDKADDVHNGSATGINSSPRKIHFIEYSPKLSTRRAIVSRSTTESGRNGKDGGFNTDGGTCDDNFRSSRYRGTKKVNANFRGGLSSRGGGSRGGGSNGRPTTRGGRGLFRGRSRGRGGGRP